VELRKLAELHKLVERRKLVELHMQEVPHTGLQNKNNHFQPNKWCEMKLVDKNTPPYGGAPYGAGAP
jgi:hypothetical protein